jgi:hypothetical protein
MRARTLVLVACLSLVSAAAWAHGGEEHVVGTVTSVTSTSITVKTAKAEVVVAVAPTTKLTTNKVAAKIDSVHVGDRVVIHAKDTEGKLVADTVQFSTAAQASPAKPAKRPVT